jgi:4-amino-4-deoxy-L-arabinose transferase-like glycosyltransferase
VIRIIAIPSPGFAAGGFTHDSAYIATVADQVRAGHGLVNLALWLVFLQPEKLPMPYHNANPGYPLLVSGVAELLNCDTIRAGLLVSALSNVLLLAGVFFLVNNYSRDWRMPVAASVIVALFPSNFADSLAVLPDGLCTALGVWSLVFATQKKQSWWSPRLAGVLLGAAWLTRSSAALIWLALFWWAFRKFPLGQSVRFIGLAFAAFLIVISPWLLHTYRVWGSPLRSDANLMILQDYYARSFGGDINAYWRSLSPPPSAGTILKTQLPEFTRFYLHQILRLPYSIVARLTDWRKIYLLPLAGLMIAGLVAARRFWRTFEFQAGLVLVVATLAVLNVRANTFELRYLGPALIVALLLPMVTLNDIFAPASKPYERAIAFMAILCFAGMSLMDVALYRDMTKSSEENIRVRQEVLDVAQYFPGTIIIANPYYFSYYTGRTALSPPVADKNDLLRYMDKYSVRYMALPTANLSYYYPVDSLEPAIQPVRQVGSLTIFERKP